METQAQKFAREYNAASEEDQGHVLDAKRHARVDEWLEENCRVLDFADGSRAIIDGTYRAQIVNP